MFFQRILNCLTIDAQKTTFVLIQSRTDCTKTTLYVKIFVPPYLFCFFCILNLADKSRVTCAVVIRLPASRKLVPSTLTNDQVLGHAEVDFTTEDSEDTVRAKVVQAVEQLAHDIKPDYFEFVKVQFKKVSVPFVGTGHKWDFKHVKNLCRKENIPKIKIPLSCKFRGKWRENFISSP